MFNKVPQATLRQGDSTEVAKERDTGKGRGKENRSGLKLHREATETALGAVGRQEDMRVQAQACFPYLIIICVVMTIYSACLLHLSKSFQRPPTSPSHVSEIWNNIIVVEKLQFPSLAIICFFQVR